MQTENAADADLLYGVAAFASFLGVTRRQAQYLVESDRVPHFNIEGSKTICGRRSTLKAWLAEQEAKAHRGEPTGAAA